MQNFIGREYTIKNLSEEKTSMIFEGYEFNEKVPIKNFQLSTEILDQISILKRKTGITKNNVLCRWHFIVL